TGLYMKTRLWSGATIPSTMRRRPGLRPAIFFRPKNTAVRIPRPSVRATSRDGAPARGTIRTDETSPTQRVTVRGWISSMEEQPSSCEQNSTSFSRSSSSTGFVSLLTRFLSATPRGYLRPRRGRDRSPGETGRRPRGGPAADVPRSAPRPPGPLRRTGAAAPPRGAGAAGGPGSGAALRPSGGGDRPAAGRPQRGARHRHRFGQVTVLPGPHRRVGAGGPEGHRAVAVPDEGTGLRPAPLAAVVAGAGDAGGGLRRRHAGGGAGVAPADGQRRAHQSRDAPHRDPALPPPLGDVPDAAPLRRRRRAPHAAGDLRQPRRPSAPPAPAGVPPLRLRAGLLLRQRHHRQPGRPRRRALRPAGRRRRRRRLAPGTEGGGAPRPADGRPGARA